MKDVPKHKIRKKILEERILHQGREEKTKKDKEIKICLTKLEAFKKARNIAFYASINGEVDTITLIKEWVKKKTILLPRTNKKRLTLHFYKISSLNQLKTGTFKIPYPNVKSKEVEPGQIDLVIVPGIGFDEKGHRIGFGMGYYDRFLKKIKCPKVGLAYEFQIIENVPGEIHDVPMDMIITEKRIIKPKNNGTST